MSLAATIVFQALRFFTPTMTTGHHVDWNFSLSSITKLRRPIVAFEPIPLKAFDRSIVGG
jgi:hypothetical protein